jgi:hypothetical protein
MENIQVSHFPDMDSIDKSMAMDALSKAYEKLARFAPAEPMLRADFKCATKGGKPHYAVHLHFSSAGVNISESESGWNVLSILQKALHTLEQSAMRMLKKR